MTEYLVVRGSCACVDLGAIAYKACLPEIKNCQRTCTDFLVTDEEGLWNCDICQNECLYNHPYELGDKIMVQFQLQDFYNADEMNPTNGWGTFLRGELCDKDGNVVSTSFSDYGSRWLVGWDGTNSYQLLEIDTTLINAVIPDGCFSLKITSYDNTNTFRDVYFTQHFEKHLDCDELVEIEGIYDTYDCCNNYYGDPVSFLSNDGNPFNYTNKVKFRATFFDAPGDSFVKDVFSSRKRSGGTYTTAYSLQLHDFVPPYVKNTLQKQLLFAPRVFIDGVEYFIDDFQQSNDASKGRMFHVSATLNSECTLNYQCG